MLHCQLDDALQRRRHQMLPQQLTGHLAERLGRRQLVIPACAHLATLRPIDARRSLLGPTSRRARRTTHAAPNTVVPALDAANSAPPISRTGPPTRPSSERV